MIIHHGRRKFSQLAGGSDGQSCNRHWVHPNTQTLPSSQELTTISASGGAGIGLETTIYLAEKGCSVYVASRNQEKSEEGIAKAEVRLNGKGGPIKFHHLDLSTIEGSRKSAEEFKGIENRLDIIIGNAGISLIAMNELSIDGWEKTFATNHLGHFAFVTTLLGKRNGTRGSRGRC